MLDFWSQSVGHLGSFWGLCGQDLFQASLLASQVTFFSLYVYIFFTSSSLYACFCVQISPYNAISPALGPALMTSSVLSYIFKNPISKWGPIPSYWGWKLQNMSGWWGGHNSVHNRLYSRCGHCLYQGGFFQVVCLRWLSFNSPKCQSRNAGRLLRVPKRTRATFRKKEAFGKETVFVFGLEGRSDWASQRWWRYLGNDC